MQNKIGRMGWLVLLAASAWFRLGVHNAPRRVSRRQLRCRSWTASTRRCWTNRRTPAWISTPTAARSGRRRIRFPAICHRLGTWTPLYLWNQTILREAMEKAAADPAAKGTEQQVGDYWKSCMNLDERAAKGKQWLAEALKPVDAMKNKQETGRGAGASARRNCAGLGGRRQPDEHATVRLWADAGSGGLLEGGRRL